MFSVLLWTVKQKMNKETPMLRFFSWQITIIIIYLEELLNPYNRYIIASYPLETLPLDIDTVDAFHC